MDIVVVFLNSDSVMLHLVHYVDKDPFSISDHILMLWVNMNLRRTFMFSPSKLM